MTRRRKYSTPKGARHWWKVMETAEVKQTWNYSIYKLCYERSAFLYELSARMRGKFEFGQPYIDLPSDKKAALAQRWPMPFMSAIALGSPKARPGWTQPFTLSINLRATDTAITRAILDQVRQHRKFSGIKAGTDRRRRNRPISWRYIEAFDRRSNGEKLNDTERSMVSKLASLLKTTSK